MASNFQYGDMPKISVNLEEINTHPGPYCMSFGFDPTSLMMSIEKVGLIHPPFVTKNQEGVFDVISGFRRITALSALGWKEVLCRDLTNTGSSSLDYLMLNLHENLSTRTFNEVEKGMVLRRLSRYLSAQVILGEYMPLLGLPSHEPTFRNYLSVEDLDERVRKALASGKLSFQALKQIMNLDVESRILLSDIILSINLNFNYQHHFIDNLVEISMIEGRKISAILSEEPFSNILCDQKLNSPQKAKMLLTYLRGRRNPRLADSEKRFRQKVSRLNLPQGVCISHPPYFEGSSFTMEVTFRDGKSLKDTVKQLSLLEGLESIHNPWLDVE